MKGCPNPKCWSKYTSMVEMRYAGFEDGEDHWIECSCCEMRGPVHDTKEEAIASWDELPRADDVVDAVMETEGTNPWIEKFFPSSDQEFESTVEELVEEGRKIGMNSGLCVHSTGTFEFDEDGIRQLAGPGDPCTIPPDHPAIKDTQGRSVTIAMHQPVNGGEKWERGFTESKSVAEEAPSVDRDRYPHNCACGSPCYISPSPLHSECTGCDNPREAG